MLLDISGKRSTSIVALLEFTLLASAHESLICYGFVAARLGDCSVEF
jgi:hypothetical protein